jgi:hypothetical protein
MTNPLSPHIAARLKYGIGDRSDRHIDIEHAA